MSTQVTTSPSAVNHDTNVRQLQSDNLAPTHPAEVENVILIKPAVEEIGVRELAWGLGSMALWFFFFMIGIIVPAMALFNEVWSGNQGFFTSIGYSVAAVAAYTLTNPLFLICAASMLGFMAHRWQVTDQLRHVPPEGQEVRVARAYLAAFLRGFFTYLMFIAGFLMVTTEESLVNTTNDQYVRIAGMVSIIGFVVGYDPNLLVRFIGKIVENMPGSVPNSSETAGVMTAESAGAIPTTLDEAQRRASRAEREADNED